MDKAEALKIEGVDYIDLTPKWRGITPWMLHAFRENEQWSKVIEDEFYRMAEAADKWNEYCKEHGK